MAKQEMTRAEWKAAREGHGEDYKNHVQPWLTYLTEVQKISQEWARLAARTAFLVNGGGLVLLPTLANIAKPPLMTLTSRDLQWAAGWFFAGLVAAAILTLSAYLNMLFIGRQAEIRMQRELSAGHAIHYDMEWPTKLLEDTVAESQKVQFRITTSLYVGIAAGIGSAIFFMLGAGRLLF